MAVVGTAEALEAVEELVAVAQVLVVVLEVPPMAVVSRKPGALWQKCLIE